MAEEQKEKKDEKDEKDKKAEGTKDEKAWEAKVEDTSGRDWSKPKTFKPPGTV